VASEPQTDGTDSLDGVREAADHPTRTLFAEYGRGQLPRLVAGTVAAVLGTATGAVPAVVLGVAVDALFVGGRPYELPFVPAAWIPTGTIAQFWFTVGIVGGTFLAGAAAGWLRGYFWNLVAQDVQHEIRTDTYDLVQRLRLTFFDDTQTGEVMSVLNNDVNQLETFLSDDLPNGLRILVMVVTLGAIMLALNWRLALVTLTMVPMLAGASYWFVNEIEPKYGEVRSSVGRLNARLENNIGGITVVKSFNREPYESARVAEASEEYRDANWRAILTRIKFFPSLQVVTALGYMATFAVGGAALIFGTPSLGPEFSVGQLLPFLLYSRRMMYPMQQFGRILNNYEYAYAAAERIVGLREDPRVVNRRDGVEPLGNAAGRVEYDDVTFSYPGADEPSLRGVSFAVDPGEMVGLVGPTGAGKTTLVKLLARLYDVDDGAVRVDGTDVRDVSLEGLRSQVGYVSQDPYLFHGSVRENVAYGHDDVGSRGDRGGDRSSGAASADSSTPDAGTGIDSVPDEAIRSALRRAGALQFVEALPDGLDTTVGERGVKLSGGQRQRLSIARALLSDPAILILDEATSHVDNETEVLIQEGLRELVADRTTFAVAHRLSTVRDADRILVLADGELVEAGAHDDLLAADGLYANLWRVQVGEVEALPDAFLERAAQRDTAAADAADAADD
jgi:ATP-binding cassette subfamily B protein